MRTIGKGKKVSLFIDIDKKEKIPIICDLEDNGNVSISIFNQLNQIVEIIDHGNFQTGKHQIVWDASGLPNGIYFIHVKAGQEVAIRKIIKLG